MYTYNILSQRTNQESENSLVYCVCMQHTYQKVLIKNNKSFSIQCIHTTYISQRTNQASENSSVYSVYIQHTYHKELMKNK